MLSSSEAWTVFPMNNAFKSITLAETAAGTKQVIPSNGWLKHQLRGSTKKIVNNARNRLTDKDLMAEDSNSATAYEL